MEIPYAKIVSLSHEKTYGIIAHLDSGDDGARVQEGDAPEVKLEVLIPLESPAGNSNFIVKNERRGQRASEGVPKPIMCFCDQCGKR